MTKRLKYAERIKYIPNQAGLVNNMGRRFTFRNNINKRTNNSLHRINNANIVVNKKIKIEAVPANEKKREIMDFESSLIDHFNSFPHTGSNEFFKFQKNTPYSKIFLTQQNFDNGTVRITSPGHYVLKHDIVFNPNEDNDFFPTQTQIETGLYPMGKDGAFHLGFFAAITVESDDVIIDLNKHTIRQSKLHNIQQRFFSSIELANSPFIPKQGPASFSNSGNYYAPKHVWIKNGEFGLTSHHSIHGNIMKNILIEDITFVEFEVAAIALNGAENSIIRNINIDGTSQNIPLLSTYSQARFLRPFLKKVEKQYPEASLYLHSGAQTINDIISTLNSSLEYTKNNVMNDIELSDKNIFKNKSKLYDGNAYGLVLNSKGVVINDFKKERTGDDIGNSNILVENVKIKNIITAPKETIGLSLPKEASEKKEFSRIFNLNHSPAFGGKSQAGPIGDIFRIQEAIDKDYKYKADILSNAQLIIAKYLSKENKGTSNISKDIINWAENGTRLDDVMNKSELSFTTGGDSMGHHMKGNIGFFISAGENIVAKNIQIDNIYSKGKDVGNSVLNKYRKINKKLGNNSCGCLITGSKNITMTDEKITNILSDDSLARETYEINSELVN
jgi:hypothetical protein